MFTSQTLAIHILLPWAMAPTPEVLETLENSTYTALCLYPIDPSVLLDLVKIRKAADEATNLAVCAASVVTSTLLSSSLNTSNGIINSAGGARGASKSFKSSEEAQIELNCLVFQIR